MINKKKFILGLLTIFVLYIVYSVGHYIILSNKYAGYKVMSLAVKEKNPTLCDKVFIDMGNSPSNCYFNYPKSLYLSSSTLPLGEYIKACTYLTKDYGGVNCLIHFMENEIELSDENLKILSSFCDDNFKLEQNEAAHSECKFMVATKFLDTNTCNEAESFKARLDKCLMYKNREKKTCEYSSNLFSRENCLKIVKDRQDKTE